MALARIIVAKRGPDSVEFGERWLDNLDEIIIDPLDLDEETEVLEGETDVVV